MKALLIVAFLSCAMVSFSQDKSIKEGEIYPCEKQAEFPGGKDELNKYIQEKLKWIDTADYISQGKVYIEFEIDTSGNVTHPKIKRGLSTQVDMAVMDAFRKMPKWIPAYNCGKPVSVKYVYPLTIRKT
ncbi:MAG TPA: energy transducer TonB [Flavobacteriales bacterium]|nr:energy transducer TonB [Flavobacteriales bacterium]